MNKLWDTGGKLEEGSEDVTKLLANSLMNRITDEKPTYRDL
jgi:hypothetical protein